MSRKLLDFKVSSLIKDHSKYNFPAFISLLRKTLGYSRTMVSNQLDISYEKLMRMETGRSLTIYFFEIQKLAEFYGVKKSLLFAKSIKYNEKRRCQKCILIQPKTAEIWEFEAVK